MASTRGILRLAPIAFLGAIAWGCAPSRSESDVAGVEAESGSRPDTGTAAEPPTTAPAFRHQAIPFRYDRGLSGVALPPEATGGGVGMLDYDGDGDLDLFFAQGVSLAKGSAARPPADCLLRNDGGGTFVDVSECVHLTSRGYGQGVCVADYDGDGDPDVFVTRYGGNTLWRNDGGTFSDATDEAGLAHASWSLGAAFFDYDGDGDLDLFVANYFAFDPAKAPFDRDPQGRPRYGFPRGWTGLPDLLYRNDGDGRFTDATAQAGVAGKGRGMGCLAADFDGDGRMDLLVANDAEPNALWRNQGDGTFAEIASASGIAYNGRGKTEANMGIARGDTDDDGLPDVLITHYVDEHDTLWRPQRTSGGGLVFDDQTIASGLGADSRPMTGWGVSMGDFDHDGRLDLLITNGHIRHDPARPYPRANPPLLWKGLPGGRFSNVSARGGPYFSGLYEGRGLACGDLDADGDLDAVIVPLDGPAVVLWNETPSPGRSVMIDLLGNSPNTDAIGATVTATIGDRIQVRSIDGGGGYISSHARAIHFGIGSADSVDRIEVRWPSGKVSVKENVKAGSRLRWPEGP